MTKFEEIWSVGWEWFFYFTIPSVEEILIFYFTKAIYEVAGLGYAMFFFICCTIVVIASFKLQVDRTLKAFGLKK